VCSDLTVGEWTCTRVLEGTAGGGGDVNPGFLTPLFVPSVAATARLL
jgi:hypothetical protein